VNVTRGDRRPRPLWVVWRLIAHRPWLFAAHLLFITAAAYAMPLVPGLIVRGLLDRLGGVSTTGLSSTTLLWLFAALVGVEVASRFLGPLIVMTMRQHAEVLQRRNLLERVRGHLFSRASGNFQTLDGVIVVRDQPQDMGPVQRSTAARFESALIGGVTATRTAAVGVEATDAEPSSISFFQSNDLASVDDVDQSAGKLAAVLALLGAEGSFGVKGSADQLLPDLLAPHRK